MFATLMDQGSRGMAEAMCIKADVQFQLGTSGPTQSLVQCLTTGVQKITMLVLAYEQTNDSLFIMYCYNTIEILLLF
jgi:hypothetical protein